MSQENNFIPIQKQYKPLGPFKLFVKSNFPFIEATFEALDNYGLYCKIVEYLNTIISNENVVEENVASLYSAFVELNNYVSNYFDNLDVQEEINNKLDDMVEQGTLQEIIASYLNSKAIFGFDSVADMKSATNLIDGSYAKTLGYYEINDGGAALYKIRTIELGDTIDEMFKISISETLLAEIVPINNTVSTIQAGILGDNSTDVTTQMQHLFESNYNIIITDGTYIINDELTISSKKIISGEKNSLIIAKEGMAINKALIKILSNNIELNNISLSGNITENPIGNTYNKNHGISLLDIIDSSFININHCTFKDNAYCGIRIRTIENESNIENYKISENTFNNLDCCIISISPVDIEFNLKDFIIAENTFNGHSESEPIAFYHYGTTNNAIISNNIIYNKSSANGILFRYNTANKINISNNIIYDVATGITLYDVHDFNINNNIIKGKTNNIYQAIILNECTLGEINNNTCEKIIYSAFRIETCSRLNLYNNSFYQTNITSSSDREALYIKDCNYINASNNYVEEHSNTYVYFVVGTCTYININEPCNTSKVFFGIGLGSVTSLTYSNINTNLNIRSNFTAANVSSNTNKLKQNYSTVVDGVTLAGGYRFARDVSLKITSPKTLSTFQVYNLIDYDVYTLNVYPTANLTLENNLSDAFGITWKSERTVNTPTQLKLMYYNNKIYEL